MLYNASNDSVKELYNTVTYGIFTKILVYTNNGLFVDII